MTLDESFGNTDPTPGEYGGTEGSSEPSTQAPQAPAERTYRQSEFDGHMANARRSWEAQAGRERQSALDAVRQEYERKQSPQPSRQDPWSAFDPSVSTALRAALQAEFDQRMAPVREQQEDISLRNEESEAKGKYPDYAENRADILEFAIQNGIPNVEVAYHAWRSQNRWQDPDVIGKAAVAAYTKRKSAQSSTTPSVEGRGGGAPTSAKKVKSWDDADEAAKEIFRSSQE